MTIPDDALQEIRRLAEAGQKIEAIKLIRQHVPVSLADAVKVLDWVVKNDPAEPMPAQSKTTSIPTFRSSRSAPSMSLPILIFLGVGIILLAVAGFLVANEVSFRKTATQVEGVVVENIRYRRSFTPVFEFPWKGETKRAESNLSGSVNGRPAYKVGEKVPLRIDPESPETAHVDTWFGTWFAPTIVGGIGLIFTAIGGGVLFFSRRRS